MKARWNRLISLLGVAAMLTTQNGLIALAAEEGDTEEENTEVTEAAEDTEDVDGTEITDSDASVPMAIDDDADSDASVPMAIDDDADSDVSVPMAIDDDADDITSVNNSEESTTQTSGNETETETTTTTESPTTTTTDTQTPGNETETTTTTNTQTSGYEEPELVAAGHWSDDVKGLAIFENPFDQTAYYVAELYQTDFDVYGESPRVKQVSSYLEKGETGKEDFYLYIPDRGDGKYAFQVEFYKDKDYIKDTPGDAYTGLSDIFDYTLPSESVSTPSVTLNSDGTVSWDKVDNATYLIRLQDVQNESPYIVGYTTPDLKVNFADYMESGSQYYVRIRAISDDITKAANSEWSEYIPFSIIKVTDTDETVTNTDNEETTPTLVVAKAATPQPKIGNSEGWSSLSSEVNKAITEAVSNAATTGTSSTAIVNINLDGTDTVPAEAISAIAGKDVILSLAVDSNTLVTIEGSQLTASDAADIKLVAGKESDGSETLNVRSGNEDIAKSIVVYSNIGADKVGSDVVLYFVNADQSLVEFRNSPVYDNGYAAFSTPLVSANYKIAIK